MNFDVAKNRCEAAALIKLSFPVRALLAACLSKYPYPKIIPKFPKSHQSLWSQLAHDRMDIAGFFKSL